MTAVMTIDQLIEYNAKRCPHCGSTRPTTSDVFDPHVWHICLACGDAFRDHEALPSQATVDKQRGDLE